MCACVCAVHHRKFQKNNFYSGAHNVLGAVYNIAIATIVIRRLSQSDCGLLNEITEKEKKTNENKTSTQ